MDYVESHTVGSQHLRIICSRLGLVGCEEEDGMDIIPIPNRIADVVFVKEETLFRGTSIGA